MQVHIQHQRLPYIFNYLIMLVTFVDSQVHCSIHGGTKETHSFKELNLVWTSGRICGLTFLGPLCAVLNKFHMVIWNHIVCKVPCICVHDA